MLETCRRLRRLCRKHSNNVERYDKTPVKSTLLSRDKDILSRDMIFMSRRSDIRELKQTDAAAANLHISIQKDSRPSEFSRPLTSINLNGDLPLDRRVSLLKLPIML